MPMNAGKETIDWVYNKTLQVEDEWSVRNAQGFQWWAENHAQTVESIGEEKGPEGLTGYFISVRTDLLKSVDLNSSSLEIINAVLMRTASMAGPVYDPATGDLSLCSLVRVYDNISQWMRPFIAVAAVLQLEDARSMGTELAETLNAKQAISTHPEGGMRPEPDAIFDIINAIIIPEGEKPCQWPDTEFQSAVDDCMQQPPALLANAGGSGFAVEFPYGEESSLCVAKGDTPHPRYGNGLFILQSFPVVGFDELDGVNLALTLNETELSQGPLGYGFGSYTFDDHTICFTSFFPNALYKPGFLPNLYHACAQRARAMSVRLANCDWTPESESFSPQRSALGRIWDLIRGQ